MKNNPLFKFFTSLRLTVALLAFSLFIIFFGTMAQEPMGLNEAVDRYFKSWFVDQVAMEAGLNKTAQLFGWQWAPITQDKILGDSVWTPIPGGYLVGVLLLFNLLMAHYVRFELSFKKGGIFLTHLGIITLLLSQLFTDIFQVESFVSMERGDRRNYSVSFGDNELAFIVPVKGGSNRVVSIPEQMLRDKEPAQHAELNGLRIEAERYWVNAKPMTAEQLIDLDGQDQQGSQNNVVEQIYKVIDMRVGSMEKHLLRKPDPNKRKGLTTLKNILFEQRAKVMDMRQVAESLGQVGEMEMGIYGLQENHSKIIFNDKGVRDLIVKMRGFEVQRTIGRIFKQETKGQLGKGTLDEFNRHADNFLEKHNKSTGEEQELMIKNIKDFSGRIKLKAKRYYTGTTEGKLGNFYRFMKPLPADLEDDQNLPAAVIKVSKGNESLGKWLISCSSDFQQSVNAGEESWGIIMRRKRHYLDFHLTLVDLAWDKYPGSQIARNYQSRVIVEDAGGSRPVDIYMNNPLRNGGYAFYQSGMNQSRSEGTMQTVLQVVKNPNWLTAYVGCIIVSVGLLYQFLFHLIGFARKRKEAAA
jgi:hypothetical protein